MRTTDRHIHCPRRPPSPARQREIDAGYFEDWSTGEDRYGRWLWPEPIWQAYVVRPSGSRMADRIRQLGGFEIVRHRYDAGGSRHDWHVPADRWRALWATLPELVALRRRALAEAPIRELAPWRLFPCRIGGRDALAVFSCPRRAFADAAQGLGARFHPSLLDRPGWWVPADDADLVAAFAALIEAQRRSA